MATQYKLIVKENVSASTSTIALTASAANTVVASVTGTDRSASANVEVLVKKSASGSSITELAYASITTTTPTELLTAPVALEANDVLYVRTSNTGTNFIVSYVEDTESVAGQSISVLNDVDTTGVVDGDALVYDSISGNWEPGTASSVGVMNDLTDVNASSPLDNQVLSWDSLTSKWIPDGRLSSLYTNIKEGTTTTLTDGASTNSTMELTGTTATLKTGVTEVKMTETSPGEIDLVVAAGASGSETAFTAVEINGTTTANNATLDVKTGTRLRIESSTNDLATIRNQASTDTVIDLPTSNGTLARTADIATDSAVVANTAKNSYPSADATKLAGIDTGATANDTDANLKSRANHTGTQLASTISDFANAADLRIASASAEDLNDITDAGSGEIITSAERTKLTGIATGATANDTDANLKNRANHTGTQLASTISDFSTQADARIAAASFLDLSDAPASYTTNQLLVVNGTGNGITLRDSRNPYVADEVEADQNRLFEKTMTTTSNRIVDIFGDALAARDNANAKKMLGFYDGSDNVVLEGMVDVGNSITGASAGSPLWLGASGSFSATAPSTADEYSRIVGYYVGAGQGSEVFVYFNPSQDWVQID